MTISCVRSFDQPDEVIELEKVRSEMVSLNGMTLARDVHQPGWRWSEHVRPLVATEWCESHHVGYQLTGSLRVHLTDGTEFDVKAGDMLDIPAGHDAWVLGDEPVESLNWVGGATWLSPLQTLKERVLVTMLFTDIVDSTATAQRLGDRRWVELLGDHDRRMAEIIDRFRGRIIKTTGDGFLAIFDGAARAIRCALSCVKGAEGLGLRIRAAVHTGEVEMAGDEVHGVAVHEAARIMSLAAAEEVLVSEVTRVFARDAQLSFSDKGELELRGLQESIRLHSVS